MNSEFETLQHSVLDIQTQLGNYRAYSKYIEYISQFNLRVSILYFEINFIDKTLSMSVDSEVIKDFSSTLMTKKKEEDIAFRIENNKIVVMSTTSSKENLIKWANHMKVEFEEKYKKNSNKNYCIQICVGLSISRDNENINESVRRADRALYLSKNQSSGLLVFSE